MKPNPSYQQTAIFMGLAVTFMLVIKLFILGEHEYVRDLRGNMQSGTIIQEQAFEGPEGDAEVILAEPLPQTPMPDVKMSESDPLYMAYEKNQRQIREEIEEAVQESAAVDKPKAPYAFENKPINGTGKVVIIIDDLGMNRVMTRQTVDLKGPLTLAFLPYAPQLAEITSKGKANGHELIIHTPMEPMNGSLDPGPMALMDSMSEAELKNHLGHIFDSFEGYVGINNHMGSRLTQNSESMHVVMNELAKRGLYFIDSKTIANSVAGEEAKAAGIPFAQRDVFLDHVDSAEFVANALRKVEQVAKTQGIAIAIGHPKKHTVEGLRAWLPTLKSKGLELIPASKAVYVQKTQTAAAKPEHAVVSAPAIDDPDLSAQLLLTLPQIEPATY